MSEAKKDMWGNAPEDYEKIVVEKSRIPKGARLVEAYLTEKCIVICGDPDPEDESHSCDFMGCSSVSHVTHRVWLDPWISIGETIDTLPPHGQRVLFHWTNRMGKERTSLGIYFHKPEPFDPEYIDENEDLYNEALDAYCTPPGWYEAGWGENPLEPPDGTVTHWMPLPDGPQPEQQGQG